jgi:arylsulfatase A-like enzyme
VEAIVTGGKGGRREAAGGSGWRRHAWSGLRVGIAVGAAATLGYALLGARRDGYFADGLGDLAWHALCRRLATQRLHLATAALGLLAALLHLASAPLLAGAWRAVLRIVPLGVAGVLVLTGVGVAPDEVTPALEGRSALRLYGALGGAVIVGTAVAHALLAPSSKWRGALAVAPWLAGAGMGLLDQELTAAVAGGRKPIALISIDTLRADRLSCYGYSRETTPELDSFAAGAVRFADVSAPFPFTLTSHATMMTGLDPAAHGATLLGQRVDQRQPLFADVPTLAEAFRAAGWVTIGVVDTCLWMQPGYGLERGFMLWRNVPGDASRKHAELETILRDLRGRPAFVFFHVFDAHSDNKSLPYERALEDAGAWSGGFAGEFDGCDPADPATCASKLLRRWNDESTTLPDELVRHISDLYDEGIRSVDRRVGRTIALLRDAGYLDHGAVAITSDHGEEFREHGRFMHDTQLFVESLHVPLLLRLPGGSSGGRAVPSPAGLLDVAPTLAAIAGVTLPPAQGRSLLAALAAPDDEPPALFFGGEPEEEAVRFGRYKMIRQGEAMQLFDLAEDPGEQRDVAAAKPAIVEALRRRLDERRVENAELAAPRRRDGLVAPSAAEIRAMGAIGYQ